MKIDDLLTHPCRVVSIDELFEYFGGHYSRALLRKYVREGYLECQASPRPTRKILILTRSAKRRFLASPSAPSARSARA